MSTVYSFTHRLQINSSISCDWSSSQQQPVHVFPGFHFVYVKISCQMYSLVSVCVWFLTVLACHILLSSMVPWIQKPDEPWYTGSECFLSWLTVRVNKIHLKNLNIGILLSLFLRPREILEGPHRQLETTSHTYSKERERERERGKEKAK